MAEGNIKVALIGCGYIAQAEHIPNIFLTEGLRLVAVVDKDQDLARTVGKNLGLSSFNDMGECFKEKEVDAVVICASRFAHPDLVMQAAAHRKHILVEKPLADSSVAAQQALEAAQKAGVVLMVAYMRRSDDDCRFIKKVLESGRLGSPSITMSQFQLALQPLYPRFDQGSSGKGGPPGINSFRESLLEESIHHLNLMRYWFGEVNSVAFAKGNVNQHHYLTVLEFKCGVTFVHANVASMGQGEEFRIYCRGGNIYTRLWSPHFPYVYAKTRIFDMKGDMRVPSNMETSRAAEQTPALARLNPYYNQMATFVRCIREGIAPPATGEDAVNDLKLIEMIVDAKHESV